MDIIGNIPFGNGIGANSRTVIRLPPVLLKDLQIILQQCYYCSQLICSIIRVNIQLNVAQNIEEEVEIYYCRKL